MFVVKQQDIGETDAISIGGIPVSGPKGHRPHAFRRYQPDTRQPTYSVKWYVWAIYLIPVAFGAIVTLSAVIGG